MSEKQHTLTPSPNGHKSTGREWSICAATAAGAVLALWGICLVAAHWGPAWLDKIARTDPKAAQSTQPLEAVHQILSASPAPVCNEDPLAKAILAPPAPSKD